MVGATGAAVAVPASEIVDVGVCGSLLVIVSAPELLPAIVGEYVTFRVTLAPGTIMLGVVAPETPKGPPLTLIRETVRFEPPTFVTVAVPLPVLPTVMVPKFRLVGFTWMAACGLVPLAVTSPEQPLKNTAKELKVSAPAAHTHPLMLVFTFLPSPGLESAVSGGGGGGPRK